MANQASLEAISRRRLLKTGTAGLALTSAIGIAPRSISVAHAEGGPKRQPTSCAAICERSSSIISTKLFLRHRSCRAMCERARRFGFITTSSTNTCMHRQYRCTALNVAKG